MPEPVSPFDGQVYQREDETFWVWTGDQWVRLASEISLPVLQAQITRQKHRITALEEVIRRVLDDEESRPGGWGPDVTAVGWLKEVLDGDGGSTGVRQTDG